MASRKTRKRKPNSTRGKTVKSVKRRSSTERGQLQDEIILVITLVACILLFLSNFDLIGTAGKYISGFLFGVIGLEAYILPVLIFFLVAFRLSNPGNRSAATKIICVVIFNIALAALIQMFTGKPDTAESMKLLDYYNTSSDLRNGGGIIGGLIAYLLCKAFAATGTYIILIAVMLIALIVITGKAILTYLAGKGKDTYIERREYNRQKRMQAEENYSNHAQASQSRKPPKTFLLDPEAVHGGTDTGSNKPVDKPEHLSRKEKKLRKALKGEPEELPEINLDYLFSGNSTGDIASASSHDNIKAANAPGYEEILQSKFGKGNKDIPEGTYEGDTTEVVHGTSSASQKGSSSADSSTDVDKIDIKPLAEQKEYVYPPISLLSSVKTKSSRGSVSEKTLKDTAIKLQSTLESFGVHVTITNISCGPAVTRYELQPEQGVKVKSITSLADDIKLNLAASDIRIEAPIPGKSAIGIEVPNSDNSMVTIREMIESKEFKSHPSDIAFAVGKDIGGQIVVTDIAKMPHLLIAGATGSGKSVCINTLIISILYKSKPSDVRLIMIDPKVVELNVYNGIPHLLIPVVTDPKKASAALNWAVTEMVDRYKKFADLGVRDLKGYNEKVSSGDLAQEGEYQKLPQIVIIIDELSDLMMVAPGEVEDAICRLAQMARAAGLHLIIATQRPSVNVITGLIKANIPSRIAFAVSSSIDSRTIIDGSGAEKLLGKGDMLFFPSGYPKPVRIQGTYVSDKEVSSVVDFLINNNNEAQYSDDIKNIIASYKAGEGGPAGVAERDEYFAEAGKFIIEKDKASIGMLQRVYKIGFNRAARIMDQLAEAGVVGPEEGTKPRKILMTMEQFENYLEENG